MTTDAIVKRLRQEARILAERGENLYRVRAYRQAAFQLSNLPCDLAGLEPNELVKLGLGQHLAKTVHEWAHENLVGRAASTRRAETE